MFKGFPLLRLGLSGLPLQARAAANRKAKNRSRAGMFSCLAVKISQKSIALLIFPAQQNLTSSTSGRGLMLINAKETKTHHGTLIVYSFIPYTRMALLPNIITAFYDYLRQVSIEERSDNAHDELNLVSSKSSKFKDVLCFLVVANEFQ